MANTTKPSSRRSSRRRPPPAPLASSSSVGTKLEISASDLRDRIERRAFELYVERGGAAGHEVDDWLRAEHELRTSLS